jgi:hypothetical protein
MMTIWSKLAHQRETEEKAASYAAKFAFVNLQTLQPLLRHLNKHGPFSFRACIVDP